jgi:hypothetical protein
MIIGQEDLSSTYARRPPDRRLCLPCEHLAPARQEISGVKIT